ncbi:hypothetical protein [Pseudomonas sp. Pseusp88]
MKALSLETGSLFIAVKQSTQLYVVADGLMVRRAADVGNVIHATF